MFIVLMLFGFNTVADMPSDMSMDQMSDMVGSSETAMETGVMAGASAESGFVGSFSLRYKPMGFSEVADDLTYRARVGWMGDVNDQVKWGVVLSTDTEQSFSSLGVQNIGFEQAYVAYSPIENLHVKAGKMGWMPDFHQSGILMSEQIYKEGLKASYMFEISEGNSAYFKVAGYKLTVGNEPLQNGTTLEGKVGVNLKVSDFDAKLYAKGTHDGLFKEGSEAMSVVEDSNDAEDEEASSDNTSVKSQTLAKVGLNVHHSGMAVPAGVFAHYLANADSLGKGSYTGGVFVGKAGKANSTSAGDFGVAVSYYDIGEANYQTAWLNEDYVAGAGNGIAARLQYNVWENSSLAVKYAFDMSENDSDDDHNLVAELSFVF